jgi:hypothetical protein
LYLHLVKMRLEIPVEETDEQGRCRRIARLIGDLDCDRFTTREEAAAELERLEEGAKPALRKALEGQPSLEVRRRVEPLLRRMEEATQSPERLRALGGCRCWNMPARPRPDSCCRRWGKVRRRRG